MFTWIWQDNDLIRSDLQRALGNYYNDTTEGYDEPLNDAVDFIQETLECCGITNYTDWINTTFFDDTDRLPSSCCGKSEPNTCLGGEIYTKVSEIVSLFGAKCLIQKLLYSWEVLTVIIDISGKKFF